MSRDQNRTLSEEKLGTKDQGREVQYLVTEIRYHKDARQRGYYLHVGPEGREDRGNGMWIRSFMVGCGVSAFLQSATRFAPKVLASITVPADQLAGYRQRVLEQYAARVHNVSCGCCSNGCVCAIHADERSGFAHHKQNVCELHKIIPHPKETSAIVKQGASS